MTRRPTTIERAFQLARSGDHGTVASIRAQLKREGFPEVMSQTSGPMLFRQLRAVRDLARAERTKLRGELGAG